MKTNKLKERSHKPQKDSKKDTAADRDKIVDDQDVCTKAPEWAEHQRLWEDDEPCDDGRSGWLG